MARAIERVRTIKIVIPLLLLLGVGLVMVYDASVIEAQSLFNNKYYFVRLHSIWIVVGLLVMTVLSQIPTRRLQWVSPYLMLGSLGLLILVLFPGLGGEAQGAQRWLNLGPLSFQPSEVAKLTTVLYLSTWLRSRPKMGHFFVLTGLLLLLLILQPDLGTAVILLSTGFLMLFVSGAPLKTFAIGGLAGLVTLAGLIMVAPYRMRRLTTFLNPTEDVLGSGYHINQILISLGSGRVWGLGLGRSRQKFMYLPEATTDSIFAVVGEEIGFVGATVLIFLFFTLFYQLFKIIVRENNNSRKLLAAGLTGWLVIQTIVNLGGMLALLPLTGVPLPLISYGRSSLLTQMASIGILIRISLTQK